MIHFSYGTLQEQGFPKIFHSLKNTNKCSGMSLNLQNCLFFVSDSCRCCCYGTHFWCEEYQRWDDKCSNFVRTGHVRAEAMVAIGGGKGANQNLFLKLREKCNFSANLYLRSCIFLNQDLQNDHFVYFIHWGNTGLKIQPVFVHSD